MNIQLSQIGRLRTHSQTYAHGPNAIPVPADKSTSHRALILSALADGESSISNLLRGADVLSTLNCLKALGVFVSDGTDRLFNRISIRGSTLKPSHEALDCGNSGTTLRLLMGVLAGQNFPSVLIGDSSLSRRPMNRVAVPLRQMGAQISLTQLDFPPVKIQPTSTLSAIDYALPVASAQLKSALLLAGLQAEGVTLLSGKIESRDHTERLLNYFGVAIEKQNGVLSIQGGQKLRATDLTIPGDPSSAAYWIGLALLIPNTTLEFSEVLLNPFRTGFLKVLQRMGAKVETEITATRPEPVGTIRASSSSLVGTVIESHEVPSLIDELPLLAMLGSFAEGETVIRGAQELRFKESDRIEATATNLRAMGVEVVTSEDGLRICGKGRNQVHGASVSAFDDHRIAMTFTIAGLAAGGSTEITGCECVAISYPEFFKTVREITS